MSERLQPAIRPQDIVLLLKLAAHQGRKLRQIDLAHELCISPAEVHNALKRASAAGLLDPDKQQPNRSALKELLVHGVRYLFPAKPGELTRGMPTAASGPLLIKEIHSSVPYVWASELGKVDGQAIVPLYPELPRAAKKDDKLYKLVAIVDALRMGRPRECKLAEKELQHALQE
jgi:hypothetical protein